MTGGLTAAPHLRRWSGDSVALDSATAANLTKKQPKTAGICGKKDTASVPRCGISI